MRIITAFLIIIVINANDTIFDIVDKYRNGGLKNTKSTLEEYLVDKSYWDNFLENKDVRYGYYESIKYLFIASKKDNELSLFKINDHKLSKISNSYAIFGANKNDKTKKDDLATPIGAYDITKKLKNLDQYYGPLAFVTSYPNLYDTLNNKTGYGIWIHGLPLNGNRSEKNTRGCIAIENHMLLQYEKIISHKSSVLITNSNSINETSKDMIASILHQLFIWRKAWIDNNLDLYLSFYNNNFLRFDGMKINEFKKFKKNIFDRNEKKDIQFTNINIIPYPNKQMENMFRIIFLENYKSSSGYTFKGMKELYIIFDDNKMNIIIEK